MSKASQSPCNLSNNKTSTKITAEQTIIIIRLIKKYKCIWDKNHPDFGKRQVRNNAFKKIGSYFRMTSEDMGRKYRRLRNCYLQELKHIREKKKSHSTLFYFDEMDFLRPSVVHRRVANESAVSRSRAGSDAMNSDFTFDTDDEIPFESLENEYILEPMEESQLFNYESNNSNEDVILVSGPIKEETALNIDADVADDDEECMIEEIQVENELESLSNDRTDEFDIFAGYLASQLREMDKISALETMEELQSIIFKRRIKILKRDQTSN